MIVIRSLVLFVLFFLLPLMTMAEETKGTDIQEQKWTIILGLITRHISAHHDNNESTRMLGLSYSNWVVARFFNTYNDASVFCGRRFQTEELRHPGNKDFFIQANLYAGFLHGYGNRAPNIAGVTLAAVPTVGFGYKKIAIEMLYIPTSKGGVFSSFLTFRF